MKKVLSASPQKLVNRFGITDDDVTIIRSSTNREASEKNQKIKNRKTLDGIVLDVNPPK